MLKKPMLVAGIIVLAVALIFVVFVFSPTLDNLQEGDSSNPKNTTSDGVVQMDIQLNRSDRLSNQGNIEQI